jgi:hypothetical protein
MIEIEIVTEDINISWREVWYMPNAKSGLMLCMTIEGELRTRTPMSDADVSACRMLVRLGDVEGLCRPWSVP